MNEYRVQVKPSGRAGDYLGKWGRATYSGKAYDGEDIYRVIFGEPGFQHSAKFRASDLSFQRSN